MPEVETLRRQLRPLVAGSLVLEVLGATHPRFSAAHAAAGSVVVDVSRRGKYLLLALRAAGEPCTSAELVVHLGMTGQLLWSTCASPPDTGHVHAGWVFSGGVLWFRDPRRFGRVALVVPGDYGSLPTLAALGPELDDPAFHPARVLDHLGPPGPPVKARLLAQRLLAGVGNYVCDEALWRARVSPFADRLDAAGADAVHVALVAVLNESLAVGGLSERDYVHLDGTVGGFASRLAVHGRAGLPCLRCAAPLLWGRLAGRGTVWCGSCQRA